MLSSNSTVRSTGYHRPKRKLLACADKGSQMQGTDETNNEIFSASISKSKMEDLL